MNSSRRGTSKQICVLVLSRSSLNNLVSARDDSKNQGSEDANQWAIFILVVAVVKSYYLFLTGRGETLILEITVYPM